MKTEVVVSVVGVEAVVLAVVVPVAAVVVVIVAVLVVVVVVQTAAVSSENLGLRRRVGSNASVGMPRRCLHFRVKAQHSKVVITTGKYKGLCRACVGRLSSGNRTKGPRRRRAALLGIGHALSRCGKQVSAASGGFDAHRQKLLQFLAQGAAVSTVDRYVDKLVQETLDNCN